MPQLPITNFFTDQGDRYIGEKDANNTNVVPSLQYILVGGLFVPVSVANPMPATVGNLPATQPVSAVDGSQVTIGAMADAAATTDTGTFSLIALVKRLLQKWTAGLDVTDRAARLLGHVTVDAGTAIIGKVGVDPANTGGLALDGTDATGVTPPAGATGIKGWQSAIYNLFFGGTAKVIATLKSSGGSEPAVGFYGSSDGSNLGSAPVLVTGAFMQAKNGTGLWDSWRNNIEATPLGSLARTADTNTPDQTNWNGRGIIITVDVTAVGTPAGSIQIINIQKKIGSNYKTIHSLTGLTINAVGQYVFCVYPDQLDASSYTAPPIKGNIPRIYRVQFDHVNNTDSITYSVNIDTLL